MVQLNILIIVISIITCCTSVWGKTLVVEGKLDGTVTVKKDVTFSADEPIRQFTYQFSLPSSYDNAGNIQSLDDFQASAIPQPDESKETTDEYGNRSRKMIWKQLEGDARISIKYTTSITANISPKTSNSAYPLSAVPVGEQKFLKKSKLVQSDDRKIIELAESLTSGAVTEHQAIIAILTYVADAIKYKYNPQQYDALYGLTTGTGNCQNFSHLAVALLRASGIPARISIGQALKDKWKIPLEKKGSSLVQGIGEGLHAWIEVWYPDLGWLPCDPQQSRLFTSTRHIKFGHGLDASDVLEYWSAVPTLPRMNESLEATYSTDKVNLTLRDTFDQPASYLLAGLVTSKVVVPDKIKDKQAEPKLTTPAKKDKPLPLIIKPPPVKHQFGMSVEIGNIEFPSLVETFKVDGNIGQRSFDRETAEYATSKYLFAQAFTLEEPIMVKDIALAMRKFGGDGTVYIDVVKDEEGKPSLDGLRSMPVPLEKITRRPGYYWVDFSLPEKTIMPPGKYWLVLRHSGEAIMNWFYTPGKRVGGPDDSRST
ncbi:MAG: transglutaminase-like domain-containing protein, partial [Desulfuromonadaceae bacterium]|nr:transglutaminase-like domain-containing protein [Desulfuromonadaceae bacterium]